MATTAPPPTDTSTAPRNFLPDANFDVRAPSWAQRISPRAWTALALIALTALSLFVRTLLIGGQFWMDEALSVGISSHSLSAIPGVLKHDGSPPLFYLLLHVWMSAFGRSEEATHALSLVFALASIPASAWVAWSLFGTRSAALITATLFALNPFLTAYASETRMYTLMALLGLLATGAFIQGFINRRRRYLIAFAICQTLLLYTHGWGIFYGVGAFAAFWIVWRIRREERAALLRDAVYAFGAAAVLFLPWLPTLLYQAAHTGSPWDPTPHFGAPIQISRNLMGGDRATASMVLGASLGLATFWTKARRRSPEAQMMWVLIAMPVGTLAFGWLVSRFSPAWQYRYFAPILAALLLLAGWGLARARGVGLLALLLTALFWANPSSYTAPYKSDMRDVGGEMAPLLHPGDLVVMTQPEQVPLAWYYLPGGLRYADVTGPSRDPQSANWIDALSRMQNADPAKTLGPLVASLRPGQQLLFVRPLTEGAQSWEAPWTQLVRRRSAQWGALLAADRSLVPVAWAPHSYRGACCVADSAVLYKKAS